MQRLLSPTGRAATLKPVRPNSGIEAGYRKRLLKLVETMHRAVARDLLAAYRRKPPELAQDAPDGGGMSPAMFLRDRMRRIGDDWQARFDEAAPKLAACFATSATERADGALSSILRDAGFSVRFKMTAPANDAYQAVIGENVALIKSIAAQHLTEVEGLVMRSVQAGRDVGGLAKDLERRFAVTKRRAALIARDQNNKATAVITRVRQESLGITQAVWMHSHGGKHPRESHLKADGKVYDVTKGMYLDGVWTWPGREINCFPGDEVVSISTLPRAMWRALFDGPMVHVQIGPDLLKGTPNHPILTARGWATLGSLERGDQIVCMAGYGAEIVDHDKNQAETTFFQLFESLSTIFGYVRRNARGFNFYGDVPNGHVDEIIVSDRYLLPHNKARLAQYLSNLSFPATDGGMVATGVSGSNDITIPGGSSSLTIRSLLVRCLMARANAICGASRSENALGDEQAPDIRCSVPGCTKAFCNGERTESLLIESDNFGRARVPVSSVIPVNAHGPEAFAEHVRVATDRGSSVFNFGPRKYEFRSVSDKLVRYGSAHVFTMDYGHGYYSVGRSLVQAKNCRCVSRPVIPGFEH